MEKNVSKKQKKSSINPQNIFGSQPNKSIFSNVFFYVLVGFVLLFLMEPLFNRNFGLEKKPLGELIQLLKDEKVQDVTVADNTLEVTLRDGTKFTSEKEASISFDDILNNNDIDRSDIAGEYKVEHRVGAADLLTPILMFALPIGLFYFLFRQMKGASGDIMSFGRSRAKVFNKNTSKITFEDVAGNEEAKTEMREIVDFLKFPDKYRKLGARIPKGILLVGSAGVGKTLLAKAIAGEANVPFFSVAGSEFMEMLVGVGSARARDLFRMAKESQPSLIFIDEIDAIGRQRGMGIGGGHDEREQTLNQILIEMDGFDPRVNVIVLAATNRPDMLDPALIRAGRFDRRITIPLPDLEDRKKILMIHMKGKPFDETINWDKVAKKTVGFSGADLENMLNEAAILAARENKERVEFKDIDEAALKVTIGAERKTMQTEEEKRATAYHEAGHAVVATFVEKMDPVYRVSIVARGASLGHTSYPPQKDRYGYNDIELKSLVATILGGRAAEEVILNQLSSGASNDIVKATDVARSMVTEYGMSPLGPIRFKVGSGGGSWLAKDMDDSVSVSPETATRIDDEIAKIIDNGYKKAVEIVKDKRDIIEKVVEKLMEKETIDAEEYRDIVFGPNHNE